MKASTKKQYRKSAAQFCALGCLVFPCLGQSAETGEPDRQALFQQKDGDSDGKLSRSEFMGDQPASDEKNSRLIQWDLDKDGFLSRGEYVLMGRAPGKTAPDSTPAPTSRSLTAEESERSGYFEGKDGNGDGLLSRAEFMGEAPETEEKSTRLIQWDLDNDGFLSRQEYILMGKAPMKTASSAIGNAQPISDSPTAEELERSGYFEGKDGNGDGLLSRAEFMGEAPETEKKRARLIQWDLDGDGFLSRQEYILMGKTPPQSLGGSVSATVSGSAEPVVPQRHGYFDQRDKNSDGRLSRDEFIEGQTDRIAAEVRFSQWDTNDDNSLARSEYINMGGGSSSQ